MIIHLDQRMLVATLGNKICRYREFVIFKPAAIRIACLVALRCERFYRNRSERAMERRVVKHNDNQVGAHRRLLTSQSDPGWGGVPPKKIYR